MGFDPEAFFLQSLRIIHNAIRGRGKALREHSVVLAFDQARIRSDAEAGKAKTLSGYLDELLPEDVIAARTEQRFFETLDRQIAAGEASMQ